MRHSIKMCWQRQCHVHRLCFGKRAFRMCIYICMYMYIFMNHSFPKHDLQTWHWHFKLDFFFNWCLSRLGKELFICFPTKPDKLSRHADYDRLYSTTTIRWIIKLTPLYAVFRKDGGLSCQYDWLVVGALRPCNIWGHIRMGTDLSQCTLMSTL